MRSRNDRAVGADTGGHLLGYRMRDIVTLVVITAAITTSVNFYVLWVSTMTREREAMKAIRKAERMQQQVLSRPPSLVGGSTDDLSQSPVELNLFRYIDDLPRNASLPQYAVLSESPRVVYFPQLLTADEAAALIELGESKLAPSGLWRGGDEAPVPGGKHQREAGHRDLLQLRPPPPLGGVTARTATSARQPRRAPQSPSISSATSAESFTPAIHHDTMRTQTSSDRGSSSITAHHPARSVAISRLRPSPDSTSQGHTSEPLPLGARPVSLSLTRRYVRSLRETLTPSSPKASIVTGELRVGTRATDNAQTSVDEAVPNGGDSRRDTATTGPSTESQQRLAPTAGATPLLSSPPPPPMKTKKAKTGARTSSGARLPGKHPLVRRIDRRILDVFGRQFSGLHAESIQLLRYDEGEKYNGHQDSFGGIKGGYYKGLVSKWKNTPKRNRPQFVTLERVVTVLMYLSDVEEGGNTSLPYVPLPGQSTPTAFRAGHDDPCDPDRYFQVRPKAGSAVAFFSLRPDGTEDTKALHMGCPVIRGTKYVATKWLLVPLPFL
jgi:hypothetical protein